jgi:hypothetical protein
MRNLSKKRVNRLPWVKQSTFSNLKRAINNCRGSVFVISYFKAAAGICQPI